jgi:uncharacterized protein
MKRILPGTSVVLIRAVEADHPRAMYPRGTVCTVVTASKESATHARVRFRNGSETDVAFHEIIPLALYKGIVGQEESDLAHDTLLSCIQFQCVVGSHAYGLSDDNSDVDRRGFFLPPAEMHWSLWGVPEQIESHGTQESYWEIQKFLVLALKANPNVLECLYSPIVEKATPLAEELLRLRKNFLSKLVYQTYNGYVLSQFKKMQMDVRSTGQVKWKHAMHLIRLLIGGIHVLQHEEMLVQVDEHRDRLLAVKRGEMAWDECERWRLALHAQFDQAYERTKLPERPDYETANAFLIRCRRQSALE